MEDTFGSFIFSSFPFLDATFQLSTIFVLLHLKQFALPEQYKEILQSWREFRTLFNPPTLCIFLQWVDQPFRTTRLKGFCVVAQLCKEIPARVLYGSSTVHRTTCKGFVWWQWTELLCSVSIHSPHDVILQAGIVHPSIKTTMDDIKWSESRRVSVTAACKIQNSLCRILKGHSGQ